MNFIAISFTLAILVAAPGSASKSDAATFRTLSQPRSPRTVFAAKAHRPTRAFRRARNDATYCTSDYSDSTAYFVGVNGGESPDIAGGDLSAVLSGDNNLACSAGSAIATGGFNTITDSPAATESFIGGGDSNDIEGPNSFIGGGIINQVTGGGSAIIAGDNVFGSSLNSTFPGNAVTGNDSFIGTGDQNNVAGNAAFVGSGDLNSVAGNGSAIVAGGSAYYGNGKFSGGSQVTGTDSFIGAGDLNSISGNGSVISGGGYTYASGGSSANPGNQISADDAVIGGGDQNVISANNAFIGGGFTNQINAADGVIGGGYTNEVDGFYSFVGGGQHNRLYSPASTSAIVGGQSNSIQNAGSTIGGGASNQISGADAFIGGGLRNNVSGKGSVIAGGDSTYGSGNVTNPGNQISGTDSFIGAGDQNVVSGNEAFLGSGATNTITSAATYGSLIGGRSNSVSATYATVIGGYLNTASGQYSIVAGGNSDTASGILTYAAGYHADATNNGSFVWSDYSSGSSLIKDTAANQFIARASGGVYLYSNEAATAGVKLAPGSGTWASLSDRNAKSDVVPLDDASVLAKVAALPVSTWRYTSERGTRHAGPMAQDFYKAFGVGEDDRHITSIDEDGVALSAIKGLNSKVVAQRGVIAKQQDEIAGLRADVRRLEREFVASRTNR